MTIRRNLLVAASLGAIAGAGGFASTKPQISIPPPPPKEPPPAADLVNTDYEAVERLAVAASAMTPSAVTTAGETRLRGSDILPAKAKLAASMVAENGGTARDQIDAARAATGKPLVYLPHVGKKQRERELKRAAKAAAKNGGA